MDLSTQLNNSDIIIAISHHAVTAAQKHPFRKLHLFGLLRRFILALVKKLRTF